MAWKFINWFYYSTKNQSIDLQYTLRFEHLLSALRFGVHIKNLSLMENQ